MHGTTDLKVIERPTKLDIVSKGENKVLYAKIISTLDIMDSSKCISISPAELIGKTTKTKVFNMRSALSRILKSRGKERTAAVSYDDDKDVIYIWTRIILK